MTDERWIRVTKANPCAICKKPDYCGRNSKFAICMRVPSDKPTKNGGYLHKLDAAHPAPRPAPQQPDRPKLNVTRIMAEWRNKTAEAYVILFAESLGVSVRSLFSIGVAWAEERKAWAFPMRNAWYEPIGIRLRAMNGKKFSVTGSKNGLFVTTASPRKEMFVVEGASDLAAAFDLGYYAIGRPDCQSCVEMVTDIALRNKVERVIICADHDEPGQRGAEKLQAALMVPSLIWTPPLKDLRESVKAGLTAQMISAMTKDLIWTQPKLIQDLKQAAGM